MSKKTIFMNLKRRIILPLALIMLSGGLYAQAAFPGGDYWSLDAGFGMTDILIKGMSYQFVVDPKICVSTPLMIGNHLNVNYSTDNILSLDNQIYLRWNFFRSNNPQKAVNIFIQSGVGLLVSYKGEENGLFNDVTKNRGSFLVDAGVGVTIPLSSAWHIEPSIRVGYPYITGVSITFGRKIPLKAEKDKYFLQKYSSEKYSCEESPSAVETVMAESDTNDAVNAESAVLASNIEQTNVNIESGNSNQNGLFLNEIECDESVMFGADMARYNVNVDSDTQKHNELVLNEIANILRNNPNYSVRIEGHANPFVSNQDKANGLMAFSERRAVSVVQQLRAKGVAEKQMIVVAFGGTKPVTGDKYYGDRNRRVELIVFKNNAAEYTMVGSKNEQFNINIDNTESIMFGADAGQYNANIDNDTRKHNEQVINEIAKTLINHPDYRVRIEGYANPIINNPINANGLLSFSERRADSVAEQLRVKGVNEKQMMVAAFGGARPVTDDKSCCNKNRRVELIVFHDIVK